MELLRSSIEYYGVHMLSICTVGKKKICLTENQMSALSGAIPHGDMASTLSSMNYGHSLSSKHKSATRIPGPIRKSYRLTVDPSEVIMIVRRLIIYIHKHLVVLPICY